RPASSARPAARWSSSEIINSFPNVELFSSADSAQSTWAVGADEKGSLGRRLWRGMELVLRGGQTLPPQGFDGVRGAFEHQGQQLPLGGGKITQHEVRGVHPARWPADSDPRPQVVTGAQGGGHRPQAVVAAVSAALFQPDGLEREVQVVMDDHDPLRR